MLDNVHPYLESSFLERGWKVDRLFDLDREDLIQVIGAYDGLVLRSRIKMDADFLQYASNLKFIGRPGAGLENIDLDYCESKNIQVFRSPEGNRDAVAEHAIGMLLMLLNNLKRADLEVRSGIWVREGNRGYELKGKTVGIIGFGYMGEAFSLRLQGFGVRVIAYDKYKKDFGSDLVEEVDMETVFRESDVISLHVPETPETIGMVNAEFFSRLKKPTYLINTARGSSVIVKDLMAAIAGEKVFGACLDVLEYESSSFQQISDRFPPEFQELVQSDKVILSPHIAGWTHEAKFKMARYLVEKITRAF